MSDEGNQGAGGGAGDPGGQASGGGTDWRSGLAEEYRQHAALKDYKDLDGLVKSHIHVQGLVGKDRLVLPGEQGKPEEWDEVYKKLGRPDKADDYELKIDERFPKNEAMEKSFREKVFALGLSKKQVAELHDWYNGAATEQLTELERGRDHARMEAEALLEKEYGREKDAKKGLAKRVLRTFADEGAMAELEEGLGNSPHLIRMLVKIGDRMSEGVLKGDGGGTFISPDDAKRQIKEIMAMPAYQDRKNPESRGLREKAERLYKIAYPETG